MLHMTQLENSKEGEIERSNFKRAFEETGSILNLRGRPSRQPIKKVLDLWVGGGYCQSHPRIMGREGMVSKISEILAANADLFPAVKRQPEIGQRSQASCIIDKEENSGKKSQTCSIKKLLYKFIGKFPGTPRIVEFFNERFQGQIQTGLKFRKIRFHTPPDMSRNSNQNVDRLESAPKICSFPELHFSLSLT